MISALLSKKKIPAKNIQGEVVAKSQVDRRPK